VDCDSKEIEPAAELRTISQGIDEVVVTGSGVAVGCGPTWLMVEPDLSGRGRPLTTEEWVELQEARRVVD
jgi:hypothetical protein